MERGGALERTELYHVCAGLPQPITARDKLRYRFVVSFSEFRKHDLGFGINKASKQLCY